MGLEVDRWTVAVGIFLVGGTLLACKKKEEPAPVASATAAPEPVKEAPKDAGKKTTDEVKRYSDETKETGTVRVAVHNLRVYKEADALSDRLTTLNKGTLVNRLARKGNWLLIEYPSGPGELSPGWVQAVQVSKKVEKVDPEAVKHQDAGIAKTHPKPDAGKTVVKKKDAGKPAPAKKDAGKPAPKRPRPGRLRLPGQK